MHNYLDYLYFQRIYRIFTYYEAKKKKIIKILILKLYLV